MKKFTCYLLLVIFANQSLSQSCIQADAGPDSYICSGGSTLIGGLIYGMDYTYSWSPTTGLSNPNIHNPHASPTSTTTYTLTANGPNLLTNPGFESGTTGFATDYTDCSPNIYPGQRCAILASHSSCSIYPHGGSWFLAGHPYTSNPANYRLWSQTISVPTGASYRFSGFMSNGTSTSSSSFDIKIIGNSTGTTSTTFSPTVNCDNWQSFGVDWNSSTNTQVTIEIRCNNSYDLYLDDLSFNCKSTDLVTVNVTTGNPSVTPAGPITYYHWYEATETVTLTSTEPGVWYKNGNSISGSYGTSYNVELTGSGNSTDYYKCKVACNFSNTVTINKYGLTSRSNYPVTIPAETLCESAVTNGNYVTLTQPNPGSGATYWWSKGGANPSNWYVWGILGTNSAELESSGCGTGCQVTIYTRAIASNNNEIRMAWGTGIDLGCRTYNRPGAGNVPAAIEATSIYPNPTKGDVTIKSKHKLQSVQVFSATGSLVKSIDVNEVQTVLFSTKGLARGVYMVKLVSGKGNKVLKLVVE